jgi:hypothetical protein
MTDAEPIGTLQEQMVCSTSVSEPDVFVCDGDSLVPRADVSRCSNSLSGIDVLLDHLAGAGDKWGDARKLAPRRQECTA